MANIYTGRTYSTGSMGSGQTKVKKVTIKNEATDMAKKYVRDEVNDYDDRHGGSHSGQNTDRDQGRTTGNHRDNNSQNNHSRSSNNHKSGSKSGIVNEVRRTTNENSGRGGPKGTKSQKDKAEKSGDVNRLPDIGENNYVFGDGREMNKSSNDRDNSVENGRHGEGSSERRGSRGSNEGEYDIEDLENPDRARRNRYQDEYDDDDDDDDYNTRSSRTHRDRLNLEREKIETHLRSSRVPETKVRGLALRLSQVYSEPESPKPFEWEKTVKILRKIIHNGLDPIVLGSRKKTNLDSFDNDPEGLAQKVSEMVHQVERDLEGCKEELNLEEEEENGGSGNHGNRGKNTSKETSPYKSQGGKGKNSKGKTTGRGQKDNKRNNQEKPGKPAPVEIQNGIRELHTQYDILQDRYAQVLKEKIKLERADASNREKADVYFEESKRLEFDLRKVGEDAGYLNETLGKAKSQEVKLKKNLRTLQEEKSQLSSENKSVVDTVRGLTRELNKLQDENSYLMTENTSLRGEMHKLQGPDKKTVAQVQELKQHVLELTAQTRRLEGEKGTLRGNYQKLEAAMEAVQSERKELSRHRENLLRDKKELETANKRLILSGDIRDI